jgi:TRAP transporter TAXI family solute receptor
MKKTWSRIFVLSLACLVSLFFAATSEAKRQLTIGTASLGGAYYPVGTGIAEIISKYVPEIQMTAEVTGGSVENPRLVGTGQTDVGICNANHGYAAVRGETPYDKKFEIRAMGALHSSVLHVITIDGTGVKTIANLKAKKIAAGPMGGRKRADVKGGSFRFWRREV